MVGDPSTWPGIPTWRWGCAAQEFSSKLLLSKSAFQLGTDPLCDQWLAEFGLLSISFPKWFYARAARISLWNKRLASEVIYGSTLITTFFRTFESITVSHMFSVVPKCCMALILYWLIGIIYSYCIQGKELDNDNCHEAMLDYAVLVWTYLWWILLT